MQPQVNYDPELARQALWNVGILRWKLWPQQEPIYDTIRSLPHHVDTAVVLCARQYGKSYLGAVLAVEDCIRYPGSTVLIVGPTIKQTVDIVHQSIKKIAEDAPEGFIRRSKSETRWYIGDSELIVGGFDIQNATRQRGKTIQSIYLEELVDSNPDQYSDTIRSDLGPALTHSDHGKMVFLTTPPKLPDHPFLLDTVPQAQLNNSFFKYTIDDNKKLTEDQYASCVQRCGGKDTIEFRREYMCEVVRDITMTVIPHFDENIHVREFQEPHACLLQLAMDWGGVRDLTVALVHSYDFATDTDLIMDEMMWPANTPTSEILHGLYELEKRFKKPMHMRWIDAPAQLVQIDLAQIGYNAATPHKTDWLSAVNTMAVRFATNKILIHPKCKFLIQSARSGIFNSSKTDFERTQTLGHCDALAALMYAIRHMDKANPYPHAQIPFGTLQTRRGTNDLQLSLPNTTKRVGIFK